MRENYLAYIVRPTGAGWELLVLGTWCGAQSNEFDVMRGRVPHGHDHDEIIRRDSARYNIRLRERVAVLGDEPLLETRRRTAYVYRAADDLPASWTLKIEPATGDRKIPGLTVAGHFRFVNLAEPVPIELDEAAWLDEVRQTLGMTPLPPIELVVFEPANPPMDAGKACVLAHQIVHGDTTTAANARDLASLAQDLRNHFGWTSNYRLVRLEPRPHGLIVRLSRDGKHTADARSAVAATAGGAGLWTYDRMSGNLFRPNEVPVRARKPSSERELLEIKFDAELTRELARFGGPLMVWPMTPPFDESGQYDELRDEGSECPHRLWALPENQRLITELSREVFSFFFSNEGMICPADSDVDAIVAFNEGRVERHPGGAMTIHRYDQVACWDELVETLGWAYLPNGPDTLWGDLHVAPRNLPLLEAVRDWCRRNGRRWARYEERNGESVRVEENSQA